MKILTKFEQYLLKKMSVEHFLQKILEIDKILYVLFNKEELTIFKLLKNSNFLNKNDEIGILNFYKSFEFPTNEYREKNKDKVFEITTDPNPTHYINKMLFLNHKL
jgi:hypothetical protein